MGGILGFFLAALASIAWEMLNNSVKNPEELRSKYGKALLAQIPDFQPTHKKRIWMHKKIRMIKNMRIFKRIPFIKMPEKFDSGKEKKDEEIKFLCNEGYNSLRSNLRFLLRNDSCKKLIISSPNSSEGKSTTSVNLAFAIAQTGAKVLLLDCDLRKGTLHNFFGTNSAPGISDVLSRSVNETDVLRHTKYKNLEIITMGIIPPNPAELLGSAQMEEFIGHLEKQYDYILFDTPPVNLVSDVFGLTRLADGIILVIKEQLTDHSDIVEALNKYELAQANILGFVLNGYHYEQDGKKKYQYNYYHRINEKND
jgi:capsular exopolysaccharide synthesis family protein